MKDIDGLSQVLEDVPATYEGIKRRFASIRFDVIGLPAPQGSKRHVGGGRMVESSKALGPWRNLIASVAQGYAPKELIDTAVMVDLHFRLPVPKSAPKKRRLQAVHKPDVDKLARAAIDSLTGVILRDDSQIVQLLASKQLAYDGLPGVTIAIYPFQETA